MYFRADSSTLSVRPISGARVANMHKGDKGAVSLRRSHEDSCEASSLRYSMFLRCGVLAKNKQSKRDRRRDPLQEQRDSSGRAMQRRHGLELYSWYSPDLSSCESLVSAAAQKGGGTSASNKKATLGIFSASTSNLSLHEKGERNTAGWLIIDCGLLRWGLARRKYKHRI